MMETFKETLKKRLNMLAGINLLALALIVWTNQTTVGSSTATSGFIHGFRVGLLLAVQIVMVKLMTRYHWATKDHEKLKALSFTWIRTTHS